MKVLHVVATNQRRGAEIFAADLVATLATAGVDQRVAVLRQLPGSQGVEYMAPVELTGSPDVLPAIGMNATTLLSLRRLVRGWRPDVVQAHGGEALFSSIAAAPRGRIAYRRITATPGPMTDPIRRRTYGTLMRRPRLVIAVAEALRRELTEVFAVHPERVFTIPNAIDPSRVPASAAPATVRASLGLREDTRVVLTVAALREEKDPLAIVKVAEGLRAHDVVFLVAGEGPLRAPMEQAIVRQGLTGRVRLLGERSDVPDLLAVADLMLLTSRTEGMPGCLIEAAIARLPVVATAVDGVPELVLDDQTGFLVPPGDGVAMTASVEQLISNASLRRSLGGIAHDRAMARYVIGVVAPEYLNLYQRLRSNTLVPLADRSQKTGGLGRIDPLPGSKSS